MRATTMHGRVLDRLGAEITGGRHPPGSVLRIEDLEGRFRASRTVIREAIRVLESMQLVSSRRRVGITILDRARWNVFDPRVIRWRLAGPDRRGQLRTLSELRKAVEPLAAAAAAVHADDRARDQLVTLGEELQRTGRAGEMQAFIAADIAFHRLILTSSGNEMFAALADVIAEVVTGVTVYALIPRRPLPQTLKLHLQVARAVRAGDAAVAERSSRGIVELTRTQVRRALGASAAL